jgi:hypothetical protein
MIRHLLPTRTLRRGLALVVAGALVSPIAANAATITPSAPEFGPIIEDYAKYEGQTKCKPKPKPGVLAFEALLQTTYPDSTWFGISRACNIGGTSEHKEGRALDWSRNVTDPAQRKTVSALLDWLFAPDAFGNEDAMIRRLGIMYIVWNRRIWSTWDQGWDVYCVQKRKVCKDPDGGYALNPHIDHVHFSFGWDGARKVTSYWNPKLSLGELPVDEEEPPPVDEVPFPD